MEGLNEKQLDILILAYSQHNVRYRIKYVNIKIEADEIIYIIKTINNTLFDTTPSYVKIAKDGIHATVYNKVGRSIIFNKKVAHDFKDLPIATNSILLYSSQLITAIKFLERNLVLKLNLPIFNNGKFYVETINELRKILK